LLRSVHWGIRSKDKLKERHNERATKSKERELERAT